MPAHQSTGRQRQHSPVLSFPQWCHVNNISERTGRRILSDGSGPPVIQLSARRIGIRESDNAAWQESRDSVMRDAHQKHEPRSGVRGSSGYCVCVVERVLHK